MPDKMTPIIGPAITQLQQGIVVWTDVLFVIGATTTRDMAVVDTEFGRVAPDPATPPDHVTSDALIHGNSKLLELLIHSNDFADYDLRITIRESKTYAGPKTIRKVIHSTTPETEILHRAVDRFVWIEFLNMASTPITSGEIKILTRIDS